MRIPLKTVEFETKNCRGCGKSKTFVKKAKCDGFCSAYCRTDKKLLRARKKARKLERETRKKNKIKSEPIKTKVCLVCNKDLILPRPRKSPRNFCSNVCAGKWSVKNRVVTPIIGPIEDTKSKITPSLKSKMREKVVSYASDDFYKNGKWRMLRYEVLKEQKRICQSCGANPHNNPGIILHVDHIKPRSIYPELELNKDNLQLLCEDCNLGKGAWDETDWRRD